MAGVDATILWAVTLENNGYLRLPKMNVVAARKRLEARDYPGGSGLGQAILDGIQACTKGKAWDRKVRPIAQSITDQYLTELNKEQLIDFDLNLLGRVLN